MLSTQTKIMRLEGLLETDDLNAREHDFVEHMRDLLARGRIGDLSEKQLDWIERLYDKHFAG